jgi:hypothetical protein
MNTYQIVTPREVKVLNDAEKWSLLESTENMDEILLSGSLSERHAVRSPLFEVRMKTKRQRSDHTHGRCLSAG